jgi:serine/threonine-protein kinase
VTDRGFPTVQIPETLPPAEPSETACDRDDAVRDDAAATTDLAATAASIGAEAAIGPQPAHLMVAPATTAPVTVGPQAAPHPAPPKPAPSPGALKLPDRYERIDRIGSGAFGEVLRVRDRVLDRVLAMKVLRPEVVAAAHMRARFLAEARITAGLSHPGIVAVHDLGELEDGRLWFTMKEVRGRTLRAVIEEVHAVAAPDAFREAPSGWTFRRLVDAFARISQAVAYAHSRGVMHRDLKPDNLMVGEFGEVLVMDWGLARRVAQRGGREPDSVRGEEISVDFSAEEMPADLTRHGDVLGTPAYMPPEQAAGKRELHGLHSDVYALGAILYHLLSGRPPFEGAGFGVLRRVMTDAPTPLSEALRGRPPVPSELVVICERAMRREIAERYPDAEPLAADVLAFLEGARRREQALAVLGEAGALEPQIASLRARAAMRREEAEARLAEVQPFDPVEAKRAGWALEDEAKRLTREAALRETEWLQTVAGALSLDPDLREAHAVLADHYRERLALAEIAHDDEDAARFEALLRTHDRGRHASFLRGEGALTLLTDPPGAEVSIERFELFDRRLVAVEGRPLGVTPLRAVRLQRGSYRLRIRAPGRAEIVYPLRIERGAHWQSIPPLESEPAPIELPFADELGPDDCYVPEGFAWVGGDPHAPDSLPARRVWLDAFVIRRFPVTHAEFLEYLNDLVATGREEEAIARSPRKQLGMDGEPPPYPRDGAGRFSLGIDARGEPLDPTAPVLSVDWHTARAYAAWMAARTRLSWRLPHELEREKAARGVDGRLCPWGDHLDATFACVLDSHRGEAKWQSVHAFPCDESPYGVRGLAGNARDWCENVWRREGPAIAGARLAPEPAHDTGFRVVRGGAWSSQLEWSRSAGRFANRPEHQRGSIGFRLARSLVRRAG